MVPAVARVRGRSREAPGVSSLVIEPEAPAERAFRPGQFSMLTAFGVGEAPIGLSGDPATPERLRYTIRAVGPVSAALARLRRGDIVGLRGPFGAGWPLAESADRHVLIVAGGLGLAPLRPVLHALLADSRACRSITLLYGARGPADILFRRQIEGWQRRRPVDVRVTVDHAGAEWRGNVGVVTDLIADAVRDPGDTIALVCGPELMMRFAIGALRDAGLPEVSIYLSMERNMKCAVAWCGRCQLGTVLVCRDGPVFRYDRVRDLLAHKEL